MAASGALVALAFPAAAAAEWEAAKPIDNMGEAFQAAGENDVASGANGLATALFFQTRTDGGIFGEPYLTRRAAGAAGWTAPQAPALPAGDSSIPAAVLAAGPSGDAIGAFLFNATSYAFRWPAADTASGAVINAPCVPGTPPNCGTSLPQVAVDGAGRGYLVAGKEDNSDADILFSTLDPATGAWSEATVIAQGHKPDVAVNAAGDLIVTYIADDGGVAQLFGVRRPAGAASFSSPRSFSLFGDDVKISDVAIDGAGNVTAVFPEDTLRGEVLDRIYASRWPASAGSPETAEVVSDPSPTAPPASGPVVVADPTGRVTAAWVETEGPVNHVFSAERTDEWLAPVRVSSLEGNVVGFDVAVDPAGTATLVYVDTAGPPGSGVALAQRRATGGAWDAAQDIRSKDGGAAAVASAHVTSGATNQADAVFVQGNGKRDQLFAARFTGPPPATGTSAAEAEGCPPGNRKLVGTDGDDRIGGTTANDSIFGRGGRDHLAGGGNADCVRGGTGNDDVGGDAGDDDVRGEDGNDIVGGGAGDDALDGGAGDDVLDGAAGIDRLIGGAGDDRLAAGPGDDQVDGGEGNDRVFGGDGNDRARGGAGEDLVAGGPGDDTIFGDAGDDRMATGDGVNTAKGGDGDDRIKGGAGADRLIGGLGADELFGRAGADRLTGGDGSDRLHGGDGKDALLGNAGDDRIRAGAGDDLLLGGEGKDSLWGDAGRDRIIAGKGDDAIHAVDGEVDRISCGTGRDLVIADPRDRVTRSCEKVLRRSPRKPAPKAKAPVRRTPGARTS